MRVLQSQEPALCRLEEAGRSHVVRRSHLGVTTAKGPVTCGNADVVTVVTHFGQSRWRNEKSFRAEG